MAWGENRLRAARARRRRGRKPATSVKCSKIPRKVPGVANAIAISAYGYHSMALLADGTVLSWGADEQGQQADGVGLQTGCNCVPTPHPIAAASGAVAIAAGYYTGAALFADGSVRNWGGNGRGELGTGQASPPPGLPMPGARFTRRPSPVAQISSGGSGSVALLQSGGTLDWGHQLPRTSRERVEIHIAAVLLRPAAHSGHRPHQPAPGRGRRRTRGRAARRRDARGLGRQPVWVGERHGQRRRRDDRDTRCRASPEPARRRRANTTPTRSSARRTSLRVEFAGDAAGTVGGRGIVCPPVCAQRYPEAQIEALRAQPAADLRRVQRSLHRDGRLPGEDGRGPGRHGDLRPS